MTAVVVVNDANHFRKKLQEVFTIIQTRNWIYAFSYLLSFYSTHHSIILSLEKKKNYFFFYFLLKQKYKK